MSDIYTKIQVIGEDEPFLEQYWPLVPREGETIHNDGTEYVVENVVWTLDDVDGAVRATIIVAEVLDASSDD